MFGFEQRDYMTAWREMKIHVQWVPLKLNLRKI
jgi:hypothetical protein